MKTIIQVLVSIIAVALMIWGGWRIERWINYKMGYQYDVKEEIEPLRMDIKDLRERVERLEKGK